MTLRWREKPNWWPLSNLRVYSWLWKQVLLFYFIGRADGFYFIPYIVCIMLSSHTTIDTMLIKYCAQPSCWESLTNSLTNSKRRTTIVIVIQTYWEKVTHCIITGQVFHKWLEPMKRHIHIVMEKILEKELKEINGMIRSSLNGESNHFMWSCIRV